MNGRRAADGFKPFVHGPEVPQSFLTPFSVRDIGPETSAAVPARRRRARRGLLLRVRRAARRCRNSSCGKANVARARYCSRCGAALRARHPRRPRRLLVRGAVLLVALLLLLGWWRRSDDVAPLIWCVATGAFLLHADPRPNRLGPI